MSSRRRRAPDESEPWPGVEADPIMRDHANLTHEPPEDRGEDDLASHRRQPWPGIDADTIMRDEKNTARSPARRR